MRKHAQEKEDNLSDSELRRLVIRETDRVERLENTHFLNRMPEALLEMPLHRLLALLGALCFLTFAFCG